MTDPLPSGWAQASIGQLIHLNPKNYLEEQLEVGFVPLTLLGTRFGQLHGSEVRRWKQVKKGYTHFADGDVVLARITPSFENGKAGVITGLPNGVGAGSTEYFVCRPLKGILLAEYLLAFFKTRVFLGEGQRVMSGAVGQQRVPKSYLMSRRLALPPYEEQQRIVAKLRSLLARLESCNTRIARVPQMLVRMRDAALTGATAGTLSEDWRRENANAQAWKLTRLGDVIEHLSYGSSAKSAQNGKVPVLRMGNIQEGQLDWSDLAYTSDPAEIDKYRLAPGDVLFNRTNSPELVGKTAVFNEDRPAVYAGYLIKIRCLPALDPEFLSLCLNSPSGREYCWRVKSDGVSQSNISATKLAEFTFQMPGREEQREVVNRFNDVLKHINALRTIESQTAESLRNLEQSILATALAGSLVAQNSDDVPAETLLSRIGEANRQFEGETILKQQRGKAMAVTKLSRDSMKAAINTLDTPFTAEQLMYSLAADYEPFKELLFTLLDEPDPVVKQHFDPTSGSVVLSRVAK